MTKPVRVILLGTAEHVYIVLNEAVDQQVRVGKENSDEMQLLRSIRQKIDFVKANPFYGDNIRKQQIPKEYAVKNLWRVELSQFWRMLYMIQGDEKEVICFIVDIMDHKRYDKIFGYRKK